MQIKTSEHPQRVNVEKGKLTVFLGAAKGVGKTYSMLEAAKEKLAEGIDLVAGWIDPSQYPETRGLMGEIPVIAPKEISIRNHLIHEMDTSLILSRRPSIVLVDGLAHTNAPGSRHVKRYQDVEEMLDAGMNVYTTLNIQDVESNKDIIAQITGIEVTDTIPDSFFQNASIKLIDIPPEELIQRLKEEKIAFLNHGKGESEKFFRPGNINALRELSMRFAAQRVDWQMETYMRRHGITGPWSAGERVMVCMSTSPFSEQLIRIGRRIAAGMKAEFLVVHVDSLQQTQRTEREIEQLNINLQLAEELGAETIKIYGQNVADELLGLARRSNVTQIIIGKPGRYKLRERLTGSIVEKMVKNSRNISIHIIPGQLKESKKKHEVETSVKKPIFYRPYIESILFILLITFIGWGWGSFLGLVNMGMLFLLPVLYTAVRWGFNGGIFSALTAIIAYDLFVVPPILSFSVTDLRYLISFSIYLLIGAYTGKLSSRLREQVLNSRKREAQTSALYSLSREITAVSDLDCVLKSVIKKITEILGGQVAIFLPNIKGDLVLRADSFSIPSELNLDEKEKAAASWVYEHKQISGKGTNNFGDIKGTYLPLISEQGISGVIGVIPLKSWKYLQPEQKQLLEAFASLTALAVNRISLVEKLREAQLLSDSDKLRNALLNSISHDLRTPLASMIGAVTSLVEDHLIYDEQSRMDLLQTIQQGAMRMNRLVSNLLDMARLESGMLKLNKQWCDIEEIIGAATERLGSAWNKRRVEINCEGSIPLINVDFVLIEQVVVNLLDNALKYSNPESEIQVSLSKNDHEMRFTVNDSGAQIPDEDLERIFDKFYRVRTPRQISGTGLGLAISKGIVELHDGRIWAENCSNSGVAISFVLPLENVAQNTVNSMGGIYYER